MNVISLRMRTPPNRSVTSLCFPLSFSKKASLGKVIPVKRKKREAQKRKAFKRKIHLLLE